MASLFNGILTLLLGLALSLLGIAHAVTRYPGPDAFAVLAAGLPALGSVLVFVVCVAAGLGGLTLLVVSVRRLRARWQYLKAITASDRRPHRVHDHNGEMDEPGERQWAGAYR